MRTAISPVRRYTVNTFGVLGYIFTALAWLWLGAVAMPTLLKSDALQWTLPQHSETQPSAGTFDLSLPPMWMVAIGAIVTVLMIVLTIYILIKAPGQAIKKTAVVAHQTAEKLVPVVTHHKKVSKKRARLISARLLFYLKLAVACLPVLLSYLVLLAPIQLPFDLISLVVASFSLLAVAGFAIQLALSRWLRVPPEKLL